MDTTGKDCRVQVPTAAFLFKEEQNEARKQTDDKRLLSIVLVVEAIIEAGLRAGGMLIAQ
jgi:hypothetical protein